MSGAVGVDRRFVALMLPPIAFIFQLTPPVACVTPCPSRRASPSALDLERDSGFCWDSEED